MNTIYGSDAVARLQNEYFRECAKKPAGKPVPKAVANKAVPSAEASAPVPPVVTRPADVDDHEDNTDDYEDNTPVRPVMIGKWSAEVDAADDAEVDAADIFLTSPTTAALAPVVSAKTKRVRRNPYDKGLQDVLATSADSTTEPSPSFRPPHELPTLPLMENTAPVPPCLAPEVHDSPVADIAPEVVVPPAVPRNHAAMMSALDTFRRRARCSRLSKEMKPCKFDQLVVPDLGGLETVPGFRGIMPVSTTNCAKANEAHGTRFANATGDGRRQGLRAPFYADGVYAHTLPALPRCHAGCITAMYDGPTVADLVLMVTGVRPAAVIDKPARNHYGNGVWQVFFFTEMDKEVVMSFTGCAVTGDAGVWIFEREALGYVLHWAHQRNAYLDDQAATTYRSSGAKYIRQDGTVTHGMSPVSFEEPTQVAQQRRQKPP